MNKLTLRCEWCEDTAEFDGHLTEDDALAAGWMLIVTDEDELDFCSKECLISWL